MPRQRWRSYLVYKHCMSYWFGIIHRGNLVGLTTETSHDGQFIRNDQPRKKARIEEKEERKKIT